MTALTGSQRKYLRGLAHGIKPAVQIGRDGVTEGVVEALDRALTAHELIKVKIASDRDERADLVPLLEARLACECAGTVGRMAILYRQNPDPEQQSVSLPT